MTQPRKRKVRAEKNGAARAGSRGDDIAEFLLHLEKERDQSPHTVKAYTRDLAAFTDFCDRHYAGRWAWSTVDRAGVKAPASLTIAIQASRN